MSRTHDAASIGPNEVLCFLLELAALGALGYAGWSLVEDDLVRALLAAAFPLVGAMVWGVFRVDGDPKVAPVPVPGVARLAIEVAFFGAAVAGLAVVGATVASAILAGLVVLHYAWGYHRITWLLRHPGRLPELREG